MHVTKVCIEYQARALHLRRTHAVKISASFVFTDQSAEEVMHRMVKYREAQVEGDLLTV